MEIFEVFKLYLNNYAPLTNIIGVNRIFPDILPKQETTTDQNGKPKTIPITKGVVFFPLSGTPDYTLTGRSSLETDVYQFSTYADTNLEAYQIYKALSNALDAMKGLYNDLNVQSVICGRDNYKSFEPDTGYHSWKNEWTFSYNRIGGN